MRGDVYFYTPHDPITWLIAFATLGPYSHVALDVGNGFVVQAVWSGIELVKPARSPAAVWSPPEGADLDSGIAWLLQQEGLPYGVLDICDQLLRLLFHTSLYVARPRSYDCSDLATRYLSHCGLDKQLGALADAPHLVTPNDLARQLGVHK